MVWMDQNPAVGKEGETVLLSLGNPAWRPGAVKHCVCVYSDMCFKSLPRLRVEGTPALPRNP